MEVLKFFNQHKEIINSNNYFANFLIWTTSSILQRLIWEI
jgi:hypothetical protein